MPKFLDNIEFYTEGYNEESLEISKEIKPIDLNEEWNTKTINLEIPKTTITYPYESPEKKRITDISRDIEKEKDEALYKIEELSKSGLNAANTLTQKGLNALNFKTQDGLDALENKTQEGLTSLENKTQEGLTSLENKTQEGLDELGSKIQEASELIETGKSQITNLTNEASELIETGKSQITNLTNEASELIETGKSQITNLTTSGLTSLENKTESGLEQLQDKIDELNNEFNLENGTGENSVQQKYIVNGVDYSANADGINSVALGGKRFDKLTDDNRTPTSAEGNQSFAAGASVHAHGDFSVAFGKDNDAYQRGGFVTGGGCRVGMTEEEFNAFYWDEANNKPLNDGKGKNGGKITDFENKSYEQSYSFGFTSGTINKALGRDSFATGLGTQALGRDSFASGMGSKALGSESFAAGFETYASGSRSFATGIGPDETYIATNGEVGARGRVSFVEGKVTDATGEAAHAGGGFTNASGDYSFAFGYRTQATEYCAMSIGASTVASGKNSFAGGDATTASGENAFVFGNNAVVNGRSSAAFGTSSKIYLNSNNSFIAGVDNNIKYGSQNIILGSHNNIGNPSSTKDCSNNFVANSRNTVDNTSFNVNNTAVFGYENIAKHSGVFINGNKNKSSHTYQTVIGKYNEDNSAALLIVGSGDDRYRLKSDSTKLISLDTYNALGETDKANYEENRKNALEVVGNGIKINSLKAIGDTDTSIYFHNDLNGNRTSSIWANDINILLNGVDGSYTSVGNKFKKIEEALETKLNLDALDSDFFSSIY